MRLAEALEDPEKGTTASILAVAQKVSAEHLKDAELEPVKVPARPLSLGNLPFA